MILRILEEGQYDLPDTDVDGLNALDEQLVAAIESGDEAAFAHSLEQLLGRVRASGRRMPDDYLGPSELVLPPAESTLEEVRAMLGTEGLIPG